MELKHIKCVNFDLDTKELLKHFPKSTAKAYNLIKEFFEKEGFEHRQYSGYISKEPMSDYKITKIINQLGSNFIWLENCIKEFDVSNAPEKISVKNQINNSIQKQKIKLNQLSQEFTQKLKAYQNKKKILNPTARIKYEKELLNLYQSLANNHIAINEKDLKLIKSFSKQTHLHR